MLLPFELQEYIIDFLHFEKTLNYRFISNRKYNPYINVNYRKVFYFDKSGHKWNWKWNEITNPNYYNININSIY